MTKTKEMCSATNATGGLCKNLARYGTRCHAHTGKPIALSNAATRAFSDAYYTALQNGRSMADAKLAGDKAYDAAVAMESK
jgi:hypothetical protein